ncbi:MAG: hypothetical protein RIN56_09230 [Sporomusaceae bacterium]|nr:hypothetical protein [Sporomusaceae bacterium]
MFKRCLPVYFCGLLLVLLLMAFAPPAMASPSLSWHTDTVYYDSQNRIVIEGYFFNNGSRTVTWVNRFDVQVHFRQAATDWWRHASASYYDLNVYLNPGDSLRWTFRITNVGYSYFDYWNVKWNVNYQYL